MSKSQEAWSDSHWLRDLLLCQGKNLTFLNCQAARYLYPLEQLALWSLRSDISCGDLADLQAHHCDLCQSETVRCDWRLWTGSESGLAGGSSGAHYYLGKGFIKCY